MYIDLVVDKLSVSLYVSESDGISVPQKINLYKRDISCIIGCVFKYIKMLLD